MIRRRPLWLLLFLILGAAPAFAKPHGLEAARAALAAAARKAAAHQEAAAQAKGLAAANAAHAASLAQQQVAAAAALRQLEDQTAAAAGAYDALRGQSQDAAAALKTSAAGLAALLPVIQRLATQPAASLLAVPQSPVDAIRGVIVLQGIAAAIAQRAAAVQRQSAVLAALTAKTRAQQAVLAAAVAAQQQSEAALSRQIDAARGAELAAAQMAVSETAAAIAANGRMRDLQDVVTRLLATPAPRPPAPPAPLAAGGVAGTGGAPVAGAIVQKFGAATVAGPAEGVSYRAAPGARVVSLCAGPVKFAAKFQSYGLVVIVDCGGGYYTVLSGLAHLDVAAGQSLARRQPVGEMAAYDPANPSRQPVLYVELRRDGTPVDPAAWLGGNGSG